MPCLRPSIRAGICAAILLTFTASPAFAHFIWLVPDSDGERVQVYFSEAPSPDDPQLLNRLAGLQVRQSAGSKSTANPLKLHATEEELFVKFGQAALADGAITATHDFGVLERGDKVFRLQYYAKTGVLSTASTDAGSHLPLDIVAAHDGKTLTLSVLWQGKPVPDAQVKASGPELFDEERTTDAQGVVKYPATEAGLYGVRARYIEETAGEVDGKAYPEARHYVTSTFTLGEEKAATAVNSLPPLEKPVTSFGAAVVDNKLYVYGGHTGSAHSYSKEEQGHQLLTLALDGGKWQTLAEGPHLQGTALVAKEGQLYRLGGFTAMNEEGEDHDLHSQNSAARFSTETGHWEELPSLPEPRSSHDAAVLGDSIYVVGGWQLIGDQDSRWHETAWKLDLSAETPTWAPLPKPPFVRRALALAAHDGKLFVIGGMQDEGGPTTRVDVYDPAKETWSTGPNLQGEPINGFGCSAFATGGRLYVSTLKGDLQRLTEDGSSWEVVRKMPTARFFHRMLPLDDHRLLIVGGANMGVGKYEELEIIDLAD